MVDLEKGRVVEDGEIKHEIAAQQPYGDWYRTRSVHLDDLEDVAPAEVPADPIVTRQLMFGYSQEDLRVTLARHGRGADGGADRLDGQRLRARGPVRQGAALYGYFKQLFAQVTNPPIDPIRERVVMSLETAVGPQANLFDRDPEHAHQLVIGQPLLRNCELEKLKQVDHDVFSRGHARRHMARGGGARGPGARDGAPLPRGLGADREGRQHHRSSPTGRAGPDRAPIPALLATAGVHHHLVREGTRLQAGLVVESGEPREVHHICCLLGYGAGAVNPYLALETLRDMFDQGLLPGVESADVAEQNYVKAAMGKGILKTISKMGISTVRSYSGAQIFEAVGLERDLIDTLLHAHDLADRRDRHRRAGDRGARPAPARLPGDAAGRGDPAGRRRAPVAPLRRAPPVEPGDDRDRPARRARTAARRPTTSSRERVNDESRARMTLRGLLKLKDDRRAGPDRGGRARQGDRQALLDRRDVARLDLRRSRTRRSRSR